MEHLLLLKLNPFHGCTKLKRVRVNFFWPNLGNSNSATTTSYSSRALVSSRAHMPKPSKGTGAHIRSHSRSSSTSKLGANFQFTQKDLPPQKHTDKSKKPHEVAPFVRPNNNQRPHLAAQPLQKPANGKYKPGFTIASPSGHEDDEDEWISSESGAATPNHHDASLETDEGLPPAVTHSDMFAQHTPTRVDTARSFNFEPPRRDPSTPRPATPPVSLAQRPSQYQPPMIHRCPTQLSEGESTATTAPSRHSPIPKRYSRPPSTHSNSSRTEHPLRPHPLIRGQSYGQINPVLPKPVPLAPLTFIPNAAISHSSPTKAGCPEIGSSSNGHQHQQPLLSSSPTSLKTSSPILPDIPSSQRRTSISSTGSINTIPIHSSPTQTPLTASVYRTHDRTRTLSSSSAALSSLTHLPYVLSHTRPPSPNHHTVSFFPPLNPQHVTAMEGIHPLLPAPYLSNHLTVLVRRTPIRESLDRVMRARVGGKR